MQIIDKEVNINTDYLSLSFFGEIEITELEKLCQLKKLTHLNLSSSDLFDKHLEIIGQLESIKLLDLDLTEITDNGLQNLKPLRQLKELRLKDNPQLTDKCIEFLSDIEQLELVHIENTSITMIGLTKLLNQKKLNSVILDFELDNEINELLNLSKKYPKLKIIIKGKGVILNGKLNQ
ncbi:hypothetical protein [Tenacibaculum geojense]|uniref:Leucine Rich repeats (2 copies) n=1 Tax=Tenacibaculum geojense TaxID=915352 RepID=A0ABW3JPL0_9FLAO